MNFDEIVLGISTRTWFKKWNVLPTSWRIPETRKRQILDASIQITMMFSPASIFAVTQPIACKHLIICDGTIMAEKRLSADEYVAGLLHEIGHKLNPPSGVDAYLPGSDEFWADDFARACGYADAIVSSLEKLKNHYPITFSTKDVIERIERIRTDQPMNSNNEAI